MQASSCGSLHPPTGVSLNVCFCTVFTAAGIAHPTQLLHGTQRVAWNLPASQDVPPPFTPAAMLSCVARLPAEQSGGAETFVVLHNADSDVTAEGLCLSVFCLSAPHYELCPAEKIWDHCAGFVIVEEAGGKVCVRALDIYRVGCAAMHCCSCCSVQPFQSLQSMCAGHSTICLFVLK